MKKSAASRIVSNTAAIGFELPQSDGRVMRIERVSEDGADRFEFLFNRSHDRVSVETDGEPLVASLGHVEDGWAVLDPNGVVIVRR